MKLTEITGNLFEQERECYIHCVSADFKMGAGIAEEFQNRFHVKDQLVSKYGDYSKFFKKDGGGAVVTSNPIVINLVTKEHYYDKPTYEAMDESLRQAAILCEAWDIFEVSMPLIGCGLDKLDWDRVKKLIAKNFSHLNMLITVYKKGED
jgi:O-acetyl-ADP-ribose deacetylase (regulator of RNase III)